MLHRYENLCSNDKLANSIHDLLGNIDRLQIDKLPIFFEVMKSNILSMLHDIQKVETMLNHASTDGRSTDIDKVLMPLLKVVTKHHVFKRLGRPQLSIDENPAADNCDNMCCTDNADFIDLTDDDRMEVAPMRIDGEDEGDDGDNERMQRSPLCLAEEEKSTTIFEIQELRDDDDDDRLTGRTDSVTGGGEGVPTDVAVPSLSRNLSLVSSQLDDIDFPAPIKGSPRVHGDDDRPVAKRRRTRQSMEVEKRGVRLRSETSVANGNADPVAASPQLRKRVTLVKKSATDVASDDDDDGDEGHGVMKLELVLDNGPATPHTANTVATRGGLQNRSTNSNITNSNHRQSSSSSSSVENLHKFAKVVQRSKNSHLVSASPALYEKPFLLKAPRPVDVLDDLRPPPAANKTWSWERPAAAALVIANGNDRASIVCKPLVIPKAIIDAGSIVAPVRGRPRLSAPVVVKDNQQQQQQATLKRPSSSSNASAVDLMGHEEPRKKRGRPRKYFTNYSPDFELASPRHSSGENTNQNSDDVSNGK